MAIQPYPNITVSPDFQTYDFIREGKREIKKRIAFQLVDNEGQIYNLALCTVLINGDLDCETASRNGDMQKILETIARIVIDYTNRYPTRKIFFQGSDKLRTRQYQLSLFSNLPGILKFFKMEGLIIEDSEVMLRESFTTGKNYDAFIFTRKKD